jgi:DNA-binding response OmpR family regulator
VLRRGERAAADDGPLVLGSLEIDRGRREVRRGASPVHLTRKEYELLELLASHPGRTFTRTDLLEQVWDFAWDGDSSTVTVHIRRLREKIEDDPSEPRHLVTVWGVGYRFEP